MCDSIENCICKLSFALLIYDFQLYNQATVTILFGK